ncbi:MAG: TolC family protein [Desulfobacterota bacterium]|nr:TolC family protein [Thermodesulfobacteriota bacterium]
MKRISCIFFGIITLFFLKGIFAVPANAHDNKTDNRTDETLLIDNNNQVSIPLKSALLLALKNNLSIKFEGLKKDIDETEIMREKGKYDTLFSGQWSKNRSVTQVGSALGSSSSPTVMQERYTLDTRLQKKFTPGTQAELKLTHEEFMTDVLFQGLKPQYKGELIASITQPLLKDFGISIGESMIRIASLNFEMSQQEFKKKVMDILYQVEAAYWDLYFAIQDRASKEKSLQRAENLRREFKIRIDAGTLAPIEIYQAEAEVALRTQEVIVARAAVKEAEDKLKTALNLYDNQRYWDITLIPTDKPAIEQRAPDMANCIQTAFEKRPDFAEAKLNIKAADVQVKYSKNQTLPRIDLVGSLGTSGIAGRPASTAGAFGLLYQGTKSPWKGHWDKVYDYMDNGDFYSYLIGIKIEFPLENRTARSQYAKAKLQSAQAVTGLKNMENQIINEVRDAVRNVQTSHQLIESATASLRLAQEKLKAEEKKYNVGMSTAHDVLEFQEDLAKAESTLAFAETSYNKALANLFRVQGTLLEEKGLMLDAGSN